MRNQADRLKSAQALWDQFSPVVSRTLLSYERDASLRQDVTQEVFLAVLDSVERIEAANNPKAYLLRVAHNVASDHIARELRHAWAELDETLVDPGMDPAGDAYAASDRERLIEAVRRLRLPYRQVIALALEGCEHEEISEVLGITPGTVRVRYLRAKAMLKELLNHA